MDLDGNSLNFVRASLAVEDGERDPSTDAQGAPILVRVDGAHLPTRHRLIEYAVRITGKAFALARR